MQRKPKDSLRRAASEQSSEANISAARRDDPPVSTPSAAEKPFPTHHNTCPRGEQCMCYITGYTDAEYDHGLALDSLPMNKITTNEEAYKDGTITMAESAPRHSGQAVDRPRKQERGEQQEWTHEKLQGLLGISNEDRYVADHAFENTLDEIKASLAAEVVNKANDFEIQLTAEQARNAALVASLAVIAHSPNVSENIREIALAHTKEKNAGAFLVKQLRDLRQELSAERQRREQDKAEYEAHRSGLQEACDSLRSQLLFAQAAMADHNKRCKEANTPCYEVNLNFSLLHQHDAEVRKPLVEALERISRACNEELTLPYYKATNTPAVMGTFVALQQIADAALAQCKKKP